jgi:hypothetical protein
MKAITLVDTLDYEHLGVTEVISGYTLEYRAEVGLLTRNIVLRGERDRQWTEVIEACPDGFDTGKLIIYIYFYRYTWHWLSYKYKILFILSMKEV